MPHLTDLNGAPQSWDQLWQRYFAYYEEREERRWRVAPQSRAPQRTVAQMVYDHMEPYETYSAADVTIGIKRQYGATQRPQRTLRERGDVRMAGSDLYELSPRAVEQKERASQSARRIA